MEEVFLTQKEVGQLLRLSPSSVCKLFKVEGFPYIKINGKYLVEKNELLSFIKSREIRYGNKNQ